MALINFCFFPFPCISVIDFSSKQVKECGQELNASTLKLWVAGALLKQGLQMALSNP